MSIVINKIKQDWYVRTYDDVKGTPHIIIDNWFNEKELNCIWHELEFYNIRRNVIRANTTKDVAHDHRGKAKSNAFRFYIDQFYTELGQKVSPIQYCLYKQRSKQFKEIVVNAMPLHAENYVNTNSDSSMISYYDTGKYYKPHHDSTQFTCLIWMYKEPKKFKGGDLKIIPAGETIECKSNRMVFFPSYLQHSVSKLTSDKKIPFGQGRYCITHFYNWQVNLV